MTTPPLDLPALRSDAEASINDDPRFPGGGYGVYLNATVLALIARVEEAEESMALRVGENPNPYLVGVTDGFPGGNNDDLVQWAFEAGARWAAWNIPARATAAEAAIARVREVLEHHTFVADDKYGDLAASQYYGDSELDAVAAESITRALDTHTPETETTP